MTIHNQRTDEPDGRPAEAEVRNAVAAAAVSGVVQAGTINGGVHHHHPAGRVRPVPRQLRPVPYGFVGRAGHLADLDRSAGERGTAMVVIGGAGGIGKTWLALTWAHRNLRRFPDGQLFVDLHGFSPAGRPADPADVLGGFLDALGVDRDHQPPDLDRRAELYRSLVADKRMLVVLDNAATTDQVIPLLPGGGRCTVVVTSRNQLRGLAVRHGARPVPLDVLTDAEAHTLLTTALGPGRAQTPATAELVELCGRFPLALGLVAARAADPRMSLGEVVADLRGLGLDALVSDDPSASLPTVLSWSLRHLDGRQRQVFALLGIAPGPDTGRSAAACLVGLPEREAHAVLRTLVDASLVNRTPGGRYAMHDLVRAYATTVADGLPAEVRETAQRRVLGYYTRTAHAADRLLNPHRARARLDLPASGTPPHPLPDVAAALAWFDSEYPCLLAAQHAANALGCHTAVSHLAWSLFTFDYRRGRRHDRLAAWQAAAAAVTHRLDVTTRMHAQRPPAHDDLGRHHAAMIGLYKALDHAERHHDPSHLAHTHTALALAWGKRGDDQRALHHARQALTLFRGLNQPMWEANSLTTVGWYALCLGDDDTARAHYEAALVLQRRHHDVDGEAGTLDNLGDVDHRSGHHTRAVDRYHRALALHRAHGDTHAIANTLDGLGHPHAALGRHARARAVWREALRLYREQGRHDDAARVQGQLDNLATPPQATRRLPPLASHDAHP